MKSNPCPMTNRLFIVLFIAVFLVCLSPRRLRAAETIVLKDGKRILAEQVEVVGDSALLVHERPLAFNKSTEADGTPVLKGEKIRTTTYAWDQLGDETIRKYFPQRWAQLVKGRSTPPPPPPPQPKGGDVVILKNGTRIIAEKVELGPETITVHRKGLKLGGSEDTSGTTPVPPQPETIVEQYAWDQLNPESIRKFFPQKWEMLQKSNPPPSPDDKDPSPPGEEPAPPPDTVTVGMTRYTGITAAWIEPDQRIKVVHENGSLSVPSEQLPAEFLDGWGLSELLWKMTMEEHALSELREAEHAAAQTARDAEDASKAAAASQKDGSRSGPKTINVDGETYTGISAVTVAGDARVTIQHEAGAAGFSTDKVPADFLTQWGIREAVEKTKAAAAARKAAEAAAQQHQEAHRQTEEARRKHLAIRQAAKKPMPQAGE